MILVFRRSRSLSRAVGVASVLLVSTSLVTPACAEPVVQELPGTGAASRLSDALRVLASNDTDVLALVAAGQAALDLDDADAAYGFFARARVVSARNPQVEVGLGRTLVRLERADEALTHFADARALGADERAFAADRGLAEDVRGDYPAAQADYRLALQGRLDNEVTRRLALSQAIGGDTREALVTLAPLIAQNDAASWRARAFVLAMDGDLSGARGVASARMSPGMAGLFDRFFARLPTLNPAERARAVHFGDMPAEGTRYASARPGGGQLASATNTTPPPREQARQQSRGRGGALIPRGAPLAPKRGLSRSVAPDRRTAVGRTVRRADERTQAATVRPMPAPIPALPNPPPPPPLPTSFYIELPKPTAGDGASVSVVRAAAGNPSAAIAGTATPLPPATRAQIGAVAVVDPDGGLKPGDTIFRPDGTSSEAQRPAVTPQAAIVERLDAASVPLADVRTSAPESILPAGTLPTNSETEIAAVRPGFTDLVIPTPTPTPLVTDTAAPSPAVDASSALEPEPSPAQKPTPASAPMPSPVPKPTPPPSAAKPKPKATAETSKTAPKSAEAKPKPVDPKAKSKSEEKPKAAPVAERYWYQVASGSDVTALAVDLKRLRRKHPVIGKLDGVTSPFGKTRRLVIGPFDSMKEAKTFAAKANAEGLDGYVWVSPEGFKVEPLPSK